MKNLEETTDEEESEPKVIRPIAHINKMVQDKNDRYGIKLNKNGKDQKFIINLGSLVTLIPIPQCYTSRQMSNRWE